MKTQPKDFLIHLSLFVHDTTAHDEVFNLLVSYNLTWKQQSSNNMLLRITKQRPNTKVVDNCIPFVAGTFIDGIFEMKLSIRKW